MPIAWHLDRVMDWLMTENKRGKEEKIIWYEITTQRYALTLLSLGQIKCLISSEVYVLRFSYLVGTSQNAKGVERSSQVGLTLGL